jgi:hypothetical protein
VLGNPQIGRYAEEGFVSSKKAKKEQKWLGPATGYTDLLDKALMEEAIKEVEGARKYNPLRPSSAGKCARRLAYELAEYRLGWKYDTKPLEPRTKRIFALGHGIEFAAIRDFRKLPGFQVKYCQQVIDSFYIERGIEGLPPDRLEGSLDWVLWSDEHRVVMDAKSRRDKFSSKWSTEWKTEISALKRLDTVTTISATAVWIDDLVQFFDEYGRGETLADNLAQLNIYATSEFCASRNISHGSVYRVNKNDSQHLEVRFRPSIAALDEIRAKFNMVSKAVDIEKPEDVPREFELGSFNCSFCDYAKFCRPGVDTRQAFFNSLRGGSGRKA